MKKKLLFCWSQPSGYMAACWRALARQEGISAHIITLAGRADNGAPYSSEVMAGLDWEVLSPDEQGDVAKIKQKVAERNPDVVFVSGWFHRPYVRLVLDPLLRDKPVVMMMDTPKRTSWRQVLGRFALSRFLKRIDGVFVPGERSFQLAVTLGIPERRIWRGTYGVNYSDLRA